MPVRTIEVRSRVVGGSPQDPALAPVVLELLEERLTVAELIRRTVEEQVRELLARRRIDAQQVRRALDRQYLPPEEIARQAQEGAIRLPSARAVRVPEIDPTAEAQKALRAFEAGA